MLKPMTRWWIVLILCRLALCAQQVPANPVDDYSGMYAFIRDGEFLQLTIEEAGRVTGFISRYGDLESDRGVFLDQFFKQGKLEGNKLTFTTDTVHSVWYEFKGSVDRGQGKDRTEEDYYVIRGTLTENTIDANKKTSARTRQVAFKSFPLDAALPKTSN
jgi:hypothetical protein